jgi:hypothetical protein
MMQDQWLNITSAAKMAGISRDMLLYYCNDGRGPKGEKIAGRWVFKSEDVRAWEPRKRDSGRPRKGAK